ncbi:hypothetical protein N7509_007983 [Penicillium cosmopolitanum]|uniref:Uncharacterized protein n=1 Tax=Penicillium cosmopolitanum TaxID=1131564 RepID=A0A9W9VZX0_9EURO|nr:uncharacterized protein N7509_007983 [Penicillium cosmopolitanum]KAJ5392493.1 hypothetical protein N7509_007983 [Penicillium cosmopolitanum]
MPHLFEARLAEYKGRRDYANGVARNEPAGSDSNVYKRLDALEYILQTRKNDGNENNQIPNIKSIMEAYRSKSLPWAIGLVTYWAKGKQLCQPRPFDWDEFEAINAANEGHKSFWVEGILGPGPRVQRPTLVVPLNDTWTFTYGVALRLPGYDWWVEMLFLYDTAASYMTLYEGDLDVLIGPNHIANPPPIPILGDGTAHTANGLSTNSYFEIEATVLDGKGKRMTRWTRLICCLERGHHPTDTPADRSDGPFLRWLLFTSTTPDDENDIIFSTSKTAMNLTNSLPVEKRGSPYDGAVPGFYPTARKRPLETIHRRIGLSPLFGRGQQNPPPRGRRVPE